MYTRRQSIVGRALLAPVLFALFLVTLTACGGTTADAPASLEDATFTRELGENQEPIDPTSEFAPTDQVNLALTFSGRPTGMVKTQFYFRDEQMSEATVDMADINSDIIFSIGQSTYVSFTFTPNTSLPISDQYRAETFLDDEPLGTYNFAIVPPADALPSKILDATLAQGADEEYTPINPTTEFAPDQTVYIVGRADLGVYTSIQADWYVDGALDAEGTRTLTMDENAADVGFSFSFLPEGGWPEGEHEVALTLNDAEVDRYAFTVSAAAAASDASAAGQLSFADLMTHADPNGVFTIDTPAGWTFTDDSDSGLLLNSWMAPSEDGYLMVMISENDSALSQDELIAHAEGVLNSAFGDEPAFELGDPVPQSDGSVLMPWVAEPEINGEQIAMLGLTYVEQRGSLLSIMMAVVPSGQEEQLWDAGLSNVVNSYALDATASIP